MTIYTIDEYAIQVYSGGTYVRIGFYEGGTYRGYAVFYPDGTALAPPVLHSNGIINIGYHLSQFHAIADMLRNEEPIYLYYINTSLAGLSTGKEPTGEEET